MAQAGRVLSLLQSRCPDIRCEIRAIATAGDRARDRHPAVSEIGIFVRHIEEALLRGEIQMAVHSAKDLPTMLPPGLRLAAVPERLDPRDALLSRGNATLQGLMPGAVLGTSSVRRRAQALRLRSDLEIRELRGNLGTRIEKMQSGQVDAILVAAAGLIRMGWLARASELLPVERMLPAPCQGALAVEVREDDRRARQIAGCVDDAAAHVCVEAERSLLRRLGGGCRVPVGALARCDKGTVLLDGMVLSADGRQMVRRGDRATAACAEELGERLADRILCEGGRDILRDLREEPEQ